MNEYILAVLTLAGFIIAGFTYRSGMPVKVKAKSKRGGV